jgi:hypothetical protein
VGVSYSIGGQPGSAGTTEAEAKRTQQGGARHAAATQSSAADLWGAGNSVSLQTSPFGEGGRVQRLVEPRLIHRLVGVAPLSPFGSAVALRLICDSQRRPVLPATLSFQLSADARSEADAYLESQL